MLGRKRGGNLHDKKINKLFNFRPGVLIPIAYALGIFSFLFFENLFLVWAILTLIIPVVSGLIYLIFDRSRAFDVICFCLIAQVVLLIGFFNIKARSDNFFVSNEVNGSCVITARYNNTEIVSYGYSLSFDDARFTIEGKVFSDQTLKVYTTEEQNFEFGDIVVFKANVVSNDKYGKSGEYNTFALVSDLRFTAFSDFEGFEVTGNDVNIFERSKLFLIDGINSGFDKNQADVVIAMMFGDKQDLVPDILTGMRNAGIAHIFAVSGLHVGFISSIVCFILRKIKVRGLPFCIIAIAATFFYCGMCDFSPSALRALLMFSFHITFKEFGLKLDRLNSIFFSFMLLLIIKPQFMLSYGFILSYTAAISIVILSPPVDRLFAFLPDFLREATATVVGAQIGVFPVSVMLFGKASVISVAVNFFLVPLVSIAFIYVAISVIFASITTFSWLLYLPDLLIGLLVKFITSIDFSAMLYSGPVTGVVLAVFYAGLLAVSDICNLPFKAKLTVFTVTTAVSMTISQLFSAGIL